MTTVGNLARRQGIERYFDPARRTDGELWQFMSKVVADSEDEKLDALLREASDALYGDGESKKSELAAQLRAWLGRPWFTRGLGPPRVFSRH
jgi:hypothetical protein